MSVKDLYPAIRPSLNLDFANTKTLDPRITFSRASTGTYYDGVTHAKAEENLLLRSQEFDNPYWAKINTSVTADAITAPDGTTTADLLLETAATGVHNASISGGRTFSGSTTYAASVYVEANGRDKGRFGLFGTSPFPYVSVNFDLTAETVSDASLGTGVLTSSSITQVGSTGIYRIEVVGVLGGSTGTGNFFVQTQDAGGNDSFAGDVTKGFYIWGAQLEERSSVTAYTATTTQPITNYIPVLQSAAAGEARFDHDPVTGESKGLLIEEQRTNLVTYSEDFATGWVKIRATVTANTIVAPDGTLTADKLIPNTDNLNHYVYKTYTAGTHTWTVYAKAGEYGRINLWEGGVTAKYTSFDLINGTKLQGNADSDSIIPVGNGWYRLSMTVTVSSGTPFFIITALSNDVLSHSENYTGDGYSGIYIWGAQLEAATFPTSYIKTTSAQATRSADSASMTGTNFSEWYRQDEGTVFVEGSVAKMPPPSSMTPADIGTSGSNRISSFIDTNGNFGVYALRNNNPQALYAVSSIVSSTEYKSVFAVKQNDLAISANGGPVVTDTEGLQPIDPDNLRIGLRQDNDRNYSGTIKKLAYYPARLTNAQLQALTEG